MDKLNETPKKSRKSIKIESPIKIRVIQFAKEQGIKLVDLCISLNVASNYLRQNFEIGGTIIAKILKVYPELSPDWLLLGIGKMLRTENAHINNELQMFEGEKEVTIKASDLTQMINETMSTMKTALELNRELLEAKDRELKEKDKEIKQLTSKKKV